VKLEQVRSIAKSHSIKPSHLSKTELIKAIQTDEGNFASFATAFDRECDQENCLWCEDCFDAVHPKRELS
jgi:hypothetical protein